MGGYQNPKTRKKIRTNPKNRMTLVSTTVLRILHIYTLWEVENPKTRTFLTTIPDIRAKNLAKPVASSIYLTRKADFLEKPENPRAKSLFITPFELGINQQKLGTRLLKESLRQVSLDFSTKTRLKVHYSYYSNLLS